MTAFQVRPLGEGDRDWAARVWRERWGGVEMVSRGAIHRVDRLPGFVARVTAAGGAAEEPVGLVTYHLDRQQCEIVSLDSLREGSEIGSALLDVTRRAARDAGCTRLWLITSNDNLAALRFYQKRGFALAALHRGAIVEARRRKPTIPLVGLDGIPLRDEIELELPLAAEGTDEGRGTWRTSR